jgi:lysophospholipase L1-like esterase
LFFYSIIGKCLNKESYVFYVLRSFDVTGKNTGGIFYQVKGGKMRTFKKLSVVVLVFLVLNISCASHTTTANKQWIGTWLSAQQLTESRNNPPAPGLTNNTLRQVIHTTLGGGKLRVQFSNAHGNSPVAIQAAHIAVSKGGSAIDPATDKTLTFEKSPSVTIPAGKEIYSDALDFDVKQLSNLAVTIYFGETSSNVTGHPGSRTTSYIQTGNAVTITDMNSTAKTEHWYILSRIDLWLDDSYACVVTLGDSITDGRGSTDNQNDRWPDFLARRLLANPDTAKIGMLNQGVGGNTIVSGGNGVTALKRFDHDVLEPNGVKWVIILEGVNDIGNSFNPNIADQVIAAYEQFIEKAHAKNVKVYGVPILPFMGSQYRNETARQTINNWIRTSGKFDAVIDMDAAVRDPANPSTLLKEYDSGDHLHLNPAGYKKMADSIDLNLFKQSKTVSR